MRNKIKKQKRGEPLVGNTLVNIMQAKHTGQIKQPKRRHKDRLKHVKTWVNNEQLKQVRRMAFEKGITVTDVTEHLIREALDRPYIFDMPMARDYKAEGRMIQAWLKPDEWAVLFEISNDHLTSVRRVMHTLVSHMLKGGDM